MDAASLQTPPPPIAAAIDAAARATGLEPELVRAVAWVESRFNPLAVSPVGARGLMQLMPTTAAQLGVVDVNNALENAMGGAKYLVQLRKRYAGDIFRALCAYNWGPGNVDSGKTVPQAVKQYAARVLDRLDLERAASASLPPSPPPMAADTRQTVYCPDCGVRLELRKVITT